MHGYRTVNTSIKLNNKNNRPSPIANQSVFSMVFTIYDEIKVYNHPFDEV